MQITGLTFMFMFFRNVALSIFLDKTITLMPYNCYNYRKSV